MKPTFSAFLVATTLAITGATAHAATAPHTKTLVVESPGTLPVLAQAGAEAIYLHNTNDGRAFLYIEARNGHQLTVLDVTNPARIQRIAQTTIPANSAFDFVKTVPDEGELIRYRNGSGVALLSFKHPKQPVLTHSSALENAATSQPLGQTAMLVQASDVTRRSPADPRLLEVVDTSSPSGPRVLAAIPDVTQSVVKPNTGTLFLLNKEGVTVVRRLNVEQEHQIESVERRHN